jgi:hypothetical protein
MNEKRDNTFSTGTRIDDEDLAGTPEGGRRPYRAPTLRYLGSVRDLTFGGMGSSRDGIVTMRMGAM